MIIQARFSVAQTGLGYQFFDDEGTLLGSRVTAGIDSGPEAGLYLADATVEAGTVGVYWDSNEGEASEDLLMALRLTEDRAGYLDTLASLSGETRDANMLDQFRRTIAMVEHQRGAHTGQPIGNIFFVDPTNGDTHGNGNRGGITDPYATIQDCHDNAVTDSNHDVIILLAGAAGGATTHTEGATTTISKRYLFIRGPGRDFVVTRTGDGDTFTVTADGVELSGMQVRSASGASSGNAIAVDGADFFAARKLWIPEAADDGIDVNVGDNYVIEDCVIHDVARGVHINSGAGAADHGVIQRNRIYQTSSHGVHLAGSDASRATVIDNLITDIGSDGVLVASNANDCVVARNTFGGVSGEDVDDNATGTVVANNEQWATAGDIPTAAATADAVWDEAQAGHTAAGTFGENLDAKVSEAGGGGLTEEGIADAVWDEAIADHAAAGSTGEAMAAASAGGDPWATAVPGAYADGTAGAGIGRLNNTAPDAPVVVLPDVPADVNDCAVYLDTQEIDNEIVAGVEITLQLVGGPAKTAGGAAVGIRHRTITTGTDGRASGEFERTDTLTPTDCEYRVKCARYRLNVLATLEADTFNLASLIT